MAFVTNTLHSYLARTGKVTWELLLIIQRVSGVVLSLFVTGLIVVMVIARYVLRIPMMWVEELDTYVAFWFFFLGGSYATYKGLDIEGGIVQAVFKNRPRVQSGFKAATNAIAAGLSCLLAVWSYGTFHWSLFGPGPPLTMELFLPLAWSQLSLLVGFSLMALYFVVRFLRVLGTFAHHSTITQKEGGPECSTH